MQIVLWKLAALVGVIGVGFLVVFQAQKDILRTTSEASEFVAVPELEDEAPGVVTLSESSAVDAAPTPAERSPAGLLSRGESAIEPTLALSVGHAAGRAAATRDERPGSPAVVQGETAIPAADVTPALEQQDVNPFADLVRAFSDPRADEQASPGTAGDSPPASAEAEHTPDPFRAESAFDPFQQASADDAPPREPAHTTPTNDAPVDELQTPSESPALFAADGPTGSQGPGRERQPLPNLLALANLSQPQPIRDEPLTLPEQSEPDARVEEPAGHATLELPGEDFAATGDSPPSTPSHLLTPADLGSPSAGHSLPGEQIVQASHERSSATDNAEPNPFLTFPGSTTGHGSSSGAGALPSIAPNPRALPATRPRTGIQPPGPLPVVQPQGSNRAGAVSRALPDPQGGQKLVLPDGSIEMTIRPRGEDSTAAAPAQQPAQEFPGFTGGAAPAAFDPFAPDDPPRTSPAPSTEDTSAARAADADAAPALFLPDSFPTAPGGETPGPRGRVTPVEFSGDGTLDSSAPLGTQQAQLTIEKQAPADAILGQDLIYSIIVRNVGRAPARNVVVEDKTPKGSEFKGSIPQAELDEREQKLIWRLGVLDSGQEWVIKLKVVPTEAGQIGSVATVSFEAAVAARTVITAPELKIALEGPREVRVGERAAFRFRLTNVGSADATGVVVRNLIPEGFEHPRGNDLEYEVGTLPKGDARDVDLTLLAVAAGSFQNQASLTADGDVMLETSQPVTVLTSRLEVQRQGPANRFVGREARFANVILNRSSDPLQGVTVVETVPLGVEFKAASESGQFDPQRRTVTWRLDRLDPGATRLLQVAYTPTQAGTLGSLVKATDSRGDAAEVASKMTVAGFSALTVDVSHAGVPVPIGDEVALRLTVRNRGTAPANRVQTVFEVPRELAFVNAKGPVKFRQQGNYIEFEPLGQLEINGETSFDVVLTAAEDGDARVRVQLMSAELSGPISEEESVRIIPNQE